MRNKVFDYGFLGAGLLIQIVTFSITCTLAPQSLSVLSLISGCLGVCSVCLAAQGNILTYLFGFAQVGTYTYLCWTQRFYGEIAINAYYFITMIQGVYLWRRRLENGTQTVTTRYMRGRVLALIVVLTVLAAGVAGWCLARWTDDTQPYLDAYTTVPALVAQVLMIYAYREHWFLWLAVDVVSVVLWLRAGDYCMAAQYGFWCANCIYGLHRWNSLAADAAPTSSSTKP